MIDARTKWVVSALLLSFAGICVLTALGKVPADKALEAFAGLGLFLAKSPIFDAVTKAGTTAASTVLVAPDEPPPITRREGTKP